MKKPAYDVPALDRAFNIIEYISANNVHVSLKTLSDDLQIPMASAFRLVKTLVNRGYLAEINHGCLMYTMGPRITQLAYNYNINLSINSVAKSFMKTLSQGTDQTSQLAVMSNNDFTYIEQVQPPVPVNFVAPLHTPIAINYSAGAKIILAHKSSAFQREYLSSIPLISKTKNTLCTVEELMQDLRISLERGYALDLEEFTIGIGCIAVAIKDFNKECIGAIGITGSIEHYRGAGFEKLEREVKTTALEISKAFGYFED